MAEHSPTPWYVHDLTNVMSSEELPHQLMALVAETDMGFTGEEDKQERWEANAEHIVRCVNAHDDLVAMLDRVNRFMGGEHEDDDKGWIELHIAVYEALQKARGTAS